MMPFMQCQTHECELGAGGMATFWLARDLRHDRQVALEVVRADRFDPDVLTRFRAEILTTAQPDHPNILPHILPLCDSGEVGGSLFYVMPVVADESLMRRLEPEG
jgi:serine/threonine-protein kinase